MYLALVYSFVCLYLHHYARILEHPQAGSGSSEPKLIRDCARSLGGVRGWWVRLGVHG